LICANNRYFQTAKLHCSYTTGRRFRQLVSRKNLSVNFGVHLDNTSEATRLPRSAGFQTCCIADFQVGKVVEITQFAGLETRDTADLEVCATGAAAVASVNWYRAKRAKTRKKSVSKNQLT
jgi:hypothetical protein